MNTKDILKYAAFAVGAYMLYRWAKDAGWLDKITGGTTTHGESKPDQKAIDAAAADAKKKAEDDAASGKITADQLAALKEQIERRAAELKAAADLKAASDKLASDRAVADKAAADKALADRLAADEAERDRIAAAEVAAAAGRTAAAGVTAANQLAIQAAGGIDQLTAMAAAGMRSVVVEGTMIRYDPVGVISQLGAKHNYYEWNWFRSRSTGQEQPDPEIFVPGRSMDQVTIDQYLSDLSSSGLSGLGAGWHQLSRMQSASPWIC